MNYYIAEGTTQRGPFAEQELMGAGLRPGQLVWREGMANWLPAEQVPELTRYLAPAPMTAAPAPLIAAPIGYATPAPYPPPGDISGRKIAAGVCGILFGTFGVHKFVAGLTAGAVTMLVISLCCALLAPFTCITFLALPVMHVIGLIEGILYLTKSDAEFYNLYMVQKRQWF